MGDLAIKTLLTIQIDKNNAVVWGIDNNVKSALTLTELKELGIVVGKCADIILDGVSRQMKKEIAEKYNVNTDI